MRAFTPELAAVTIRSFFAFHLTVSTSDLCIIAFFDSKNIEEIFHLKTVTESFQSTTLGNWDFSLAEQTFDLAIMSTGFSTGNPSSKYEHRRTSALLRNIRNIKICIEKKTYRFRNIRKRKDFNKKNTLPYVKFVLRLSCVVQCKVKAVFIEILSFS